MFRRLGQFVVRHRLPVLATLVVASVCTAYFAPRVEFNFSPRQFFRTGSDLGEFREEFAQTFEREDNLLAVVVEGDDPFEPGVLSHLRNKTLEIRQLDRVERAESIATFPLPRPGESAKSLTVEPLLAQKIERTSDGEPTPVSDELANRLAELSMEEPLVRGRLVDDDRTAAVVLAWLDPNIQRVRNLKKAIADVRSTLDAHPFPEHVDADLGGVPALRGEIVDSLRSEQLFFIPLTALVYVFVLGWLFRRPSGVLLPLAVVAMAVSATLAIMVWTGSTMNVVNNVLPTVIVIIGVADSIHFLTRDAEEVASGTDREEAATRAVQYVGFACLMTSTTTAIGFASLLYADTDLLMNFGWQAAAGVMLAYLFTVLFLPAALTYFRPVRRPTGEPEDAADEDGALEQYLMALADAVLARPKTAIVASLVVAAVAAFSASKVVIDTTILEVFRPGHPTYEITETMNRKFGGFLPFEVSLQSDEEGRFKSPDIYRRLRAFQKDAARKKPVLSTQTFVDFHQSARAALLDDPEERHEMPSSSTEVQQLNLMLAGSPDEPTGVHQYVTRDFDHARVLLRVADAGARRQIELADQLRADLEEHFGDVDDIDYRLTGDAYVASVALDSFIRDLFYSLVYAGFVIFLLMAAYFRSIRIGLVSMIPNTLPLLLTFGYMGWREINLNSTTVIIFAIGLGIAVDDTIHVLARFREEADRDTSIRDAVERTYFGAGRAILLTSILLLVGLSTLLFSDFVPTYQFGLLTGITILGAILGDLVLLPALLFYLFRDPSDEASS